MFSSKRKKEVVKRKRHLSWMNYHLEILPVISWYKSCSDVVKVENTRIYSLTRIEYWKFFCPYSIERILENRNVSTTKKKQRNYCDLKNKTKQKFQPQSQHSVWFETLTRKRITISAKTASTIFVFCFC